MGEAFICRRGGGGIAGLNFKVVGGTTQPTNPRENTIWVNTSVAITSWVFSATAPTNPAAGMVWFSIGSISPVAFNAVKKNGIWVYPSGCQQHVSGAWVTKTAKTYQNNAWKDWELWLYNSGDVNLAFTGGYTAYDASNNFPVTPGETSVKFSSARGSYTRWRSNNILDFSPYNTIKASWTGSYFQMQILNRTGTVQKYSRSDTLDVSDISSGYFEFGCNHYNVSEGASERNCTVTSIIVR